MAEATINILHSEAEPDEDGWVHFEQKVDDLNISIWHDGDGRWLDEDEFELAAPTLLEVDVQGHLRICDEKPVDEVDVQSESFVE